MYPDLDIIYFTLFPWENAYSSVSLSFTREFQKNNRVFYINHPYSLKVFLREWNTTHAKARRKNMLMNKMRYETVPNMDNVVAVHPPLTLPINWMSPGKNYDRMWEFNNKIIVDTIRQVIKDYNLTNYIFLNCFNPYFAPVLPPDLKPKLNVYTCIDDMYEEEYTAKHGARLEEQAMEQADVAFVTSRNLYRLKQHLNPNTYILHNAVDITIFEKALEQPLAKPKELEGVTGKIIGFTGNINEYRLDYSIFKKIAEVHSDKTLCIVGPLNSETYKEYGLDKMPNVIFTGGKNITELPAFLQHFDVTIIPFVLNKLTASIYPLKINEYLAAGKPVVATNFSEDIRTFADDIYIAQDETHFVQLIDQAIAEDNEDRIASRAATARKNTWTERVREFWEVVGKHLPQQKLMAGSNVV